MDPTMLAQSIAQSERVHLPDLSSLSAHELWHATELAFAERKHNSVFANLVSSSHSACGSDRPYVERFTRLRSEMSKMGYVAPDWIWTALLRIGLHDCHDCWIQSRLRDEQSVNNPRITLMGLSVISLLNCQPPETIQPKSPCRRTPPPSLSLYLVKRPTTRGTRRRNPRANKINRVGNLPTIQLASNAGSVTTPKSNAGMTSREVRPIGGGRSTSRRVIYPRRRRTYMMPWAKSSCSGTPTSPTSSIHQVQVMTCSLEQSAMTAHRTVKLQLPTFNGVLTATPVPMQPDDPTSCPNLALRKAKQ